MLQFDDNFVKGEKTVKGQIGSGIFLPDNFAPHFFRLAGLPGAGFAGDFALAAGESALFLPQCLKTQESYQLNLN